MQIYTDFQDNLHFPLIFCIFLFQRPFLPSKNTNVHHPYINTSIYTADFQPYQSNIDVHQHSLPVHRTSTNFAAENDTCRESHIL